MTGGEPFLLPDIGRILAACVGAAPTTVLTKRHAVWFPADLIGHAVLLYFRFPLGLRTVEELLAARGIIVSHETVRQWARKFGQQFRQPDPSASSPCRRQVASR